MTSTPSRRQLLVAVGGLALLPVAACTKDGEPAKVDPDDAIRAAAVERERALLAMYAAATTPVALTVRADHEAHLAALTRQPTPSPTPSPPPAPMASASAGPVPPKASLVAAERAAAQAHAAAALDASPELAALLASLAASEASHPVALA